MTNTVLFEKVAKLIQRNYFAWPVYDNILGNSHVTHIKCGPFGELLKRNVLEKWWSHIITENDETIFPVSSTKENVLSDGKIISSGVEESNISEWKQHFLYLKELNSGKFPFGIAQCRHHVDQHQDGEVDANETDVARSFFSPSHSLCLSVHFFSPPQLSSQWFDYWQRQRKKWWRKFAYTPARFSLSGVQSEACGQCVEIKASFPWGEQLVEQLYHRGSGPFKEQPENLGDQYQKDSRRTMFPHVIECVMSLETAILTYLCDCYQEKERGDHLRKILRLHRQLAPYTVSFAIASSGNTQSLRELGLYLTKLLRKSGISVLLLPDLAQVSLENQYIRNDEMGIPYTVVLNESSLKDGIARIRNRDTALLEQVHINDMQSMLTKIIQSSSP